MSPARPWTAWWLPKGTIRTISRVGIISFIGARSWTPSLCRARSRLSCSASTLSPTCGRALGFLRTINREGLHFRWRNRYTQSYILKWLNRATLLKPAQNTCLAPDFSKRVALVAQLPLFEVAARRPFHKPARFEKRILRYMLRASRHVLTGRL